MNKSSVEPAFPQHYNRAIADGAGGMTLRDYIAIGMISSSVANASGLGELSDEQLLEVGETVGRVAYKFADGILKARSA